LVALSELSYAAEMCAGRWAGHRRLATNDRPRCSASTSPMPSTCSHCGI